MILITMRLAYYATLDKVLSELEVRLNGNDQGMLCFGRYLSQGDA